MSMNHYPHPRSSNGAGGVVYPPATPVVLPRLLPLESCPVCGTWRVWDTALGQHVGSTYPSIEAALAFINRLLDVTQRVAGLSEMVVRP